MNNKYRNNYIDSTLNDIDNDLHVDGDRLNKAIFYCDDAERIIKAEQERLIKKLHKEQAAENKSLDAQLIGEEIAMA
tara:strand:- start:42 stop:272 length:231 start_codon:yes stop_codon:yes gene_type:complete